MAMSRFADTSFLFALYFPNEASEAAARLAAEDCDRIVLSPLVVYEFQQAVWLDVFRYEHGYRDAVRRDQAYSGLAAFEINLERGMFEVRAIAFEPLLAEALRLTGVHTLRHGIRSMDILHLAAARLLGCSEFLSFDHLQRRVAELEGFSLPL